MRASIARTWFLFIGVGLIVALAVVLTAGSDDVPGPIGSVPTSPAVKAEPTDVAGEDEPGDALGAQPNVVLVMADDMRVDDLAFAPNLRRLVAEQGLTFENSFSPFPLCCPARASLLTGQYAHNHKVLWHEPPFGYAAFDDSRTLATSLQEAGYSTGFIGKYLNRYGADTAKVTGEPSYTHVPNGWDDWRAAIENPGNAGFHGQTYDYFDTPFNVNGTVDNRYRGVYQSRVIGDFSVDMADRFAQRDDPFFMYVNYVAPHHGMSEDGQSATSAVDADGETFRIPTAAAPAWVRGRFDDVIDRASGVARTGERIESDLRDKPPAVRKAARVLGESGETALLTATRRRAEAVFVMDRHIARLIRELERSGEWERTVFVFTSDNGAMLGEHGSGLTKVRAYEPSLRVPTLVTGPGLRTREKRYDPLSTVDLTATVLDLADARAPYPGDGVSRVETLVQGDSGWTTPIVTEAILTSRGNDPAFTDRRTTIGIRVSRYSYTRYRDGSVELYDLARDPRQDDNVADAADHAEAREALDELWPRVKDCRAKACRQRLPTVLAADADQNRSDTDAYWAEITAAYGW